MKITTALSVAVLLSLSLPLQANAKLSVIASFSILGDMAKTSARIVLSCAPSSALIAMRMCMNRPQQMRLRWPKPT
nr:hypothetical protein KXZ65_21045 [Pectobacterium sp. PL152]